MLDTAPESWSGRLVQVLDQGQGLVRQHAGAVRIAGLQGFSGLADERGPRVPLLALWIGQGAIGEGPEEALRTRQRVFGLFPGLFAPGFGQEARRLRLGIGARLRGRVRACGVRAGCVGSGGRCRSEPGGRLLGQARTGTTSSKRRRRAILRERIRQPPLEASG